MSERKSLECCCWGKLENCLYCRGTGIIDDKDTAEKIDEKLSQTRVALCSSCGRQNRIMNDFLNQGGEPLCYACRSPIFTKSENIFDMFPYKRKSKIENRKSNIEYSVLVFSDLARSINIVFKRN